MSKEVRARWYLMVAIVMWLLVAPGCGMRDIGGLSSVDAPAAVQSTAAPAAATVALTANELEAAHSSGGHRVWLSVQQ
ncbi:MAG TPA: hypothetical protein VM366_08790 [Anaerolineae bacterium]|nr:hypothetical protein [Anaerolineae bacterium]